MKRRLQHLADTQRWHAELWAKVERWGLGPSFSIRSWVRHPWSNTRYQFWNRTPHLPRWELSEATTGTVNHERHEAEFLMLSDRCTRCGMQKNYSNWVPSTEET